MPKVQMITKERNTCKDIQQKQKINNQWLQRIQNEDTMNEKKFTMKTTVVVFKQKFNEIQVKFRQNEEKMEKEIRSFKQQLYYGQEQSIKHRRKIYNSHMEAQLGILRRSEILFKYKIECYSSYYSYYINRDAQNNTEMTDKIIYQKGKIQADQLQKYKQLDDVVFKLESYNKLVSIEQDDQNKNLLDRIMFLLGCNLKCLKLFIIKLKEQKSYILQLLPTQFADLEMIGECKPNLIQLKIDQFKLIFNVLQIQFRQNEEKIKQMEQKIKDFKLQQLHSQGKQIKKRSENYRLFIKFQKCIIDDMERLFLLKIESYASYYHYLKRDIKNIQYQIMDNNNKLRNSKYTIQKDLLQKYQWLKESNQRLDYYKNLIKTEKDCQIKIFINNSIELLNINVRYLQQFIKRFRQQCSQIEMLLQKQFDKQIDISGVRILQLIQLTLDAFKYRFNKIKVRFRQNEEKMEKEIRSFKQQIENRQDKSIKNRREIYNNYAKSQECIVNQLEKLFRQKIKSYSSYYDYYINRDAQNNNQMTDKIIYQKGKVQADQMKKQQQLYDVFLKLESYNRQMRNEQDDQNKNVLNKIITSLQKIENYYQLFISRLKKQNSYILQLLLAEFDNQKKQLPECNFQQLQLTIDQFKQYFNSMQVRFKRNEEKFKQKLLNSRKQIIFRRENYKDHLLFQNCIIVEMERLFTFKILQYEDIQNTQEFIIAKNKKLRDQKDTIQKYLQQKHLIIANNKKLRDQKNMIQKDLPQKQKWLKESKQRLEYYKNLIETEKDYQIKIFINKAIELFNINVRCLQQFIKRLQKQQNQVSQLINKQY